MTDSTKPGAGAAVTRTSLAAEALALLTGFSGAPLSHGDLTIIRAALTAASGEQQSAVLDLAAEYVRGQRSRDAEVERLTRELAETKAGLAQHEAIPMLAEMSRDRLAKDLELVNDAINYDTHPTAVLAFQRIEDCITAALARGGK
ncbi:MAG TPA: hypothetical protein VER11_34360 [Polyangiaceae bacterium]|nr:hypothetical protein [Polyangiaceae bacterium]